MNFEAYEPGSACEVEKLFTDVFSDSEGPAEGLLIGRLVLELQKTTDSRDIYGFIARDVGGIVGSIFFTRLKFEDDISAFILSPVAVATRCQKTGIGRGLINYGIDHLKKNGVVLLFTYGDPHFYSKVGFRRIAEDVVQVKEYEETKIKDSDVVWIDQTNVEPKLSYPEGWLGQSLVDGDIEPLRGRPVCVDALNDQRYW